MIGVCRGHGPLYSQGCNSGIVGGMDAAVLVAMVVGFMATVVAVVGFNLQLNSRLDGHFARLDARFDRLDDKIDRLAEKLEEHVLDTGRHT